jgi:glycosyltransferase involved in cell wall biosynthesis
MIVVPMPLSFCLVTTFYPPYHFGGDGICVYRLAEALARRGHTVDVLHSRDSYRLAHPDEPELAYEHHPNVTLHALESGSPRLAALMAHQLGRPAAYRRRIDELLGHGRHDVIHYHNVSLMGGPGILRAGKSDKVVKLYTAHEYWLVFPTHVLFRMDKEACSDKTCLRCTLHQRRPPQAWRATGWLKRCTEEIDMFLMPSRFALERHRADGLRGPMQVLPHFVPEGTHEAAGAPEPAASPVEDDAPYFLYVGRLEKLKGVQDLLQLFGEYRKARLLVVGAGDYRPELERLARDLPHVRFLGQVHAERLSRLYANALAVLVPSLCYEVFNLIPVEAFAQGTPAIVRDLGATPELVHQSGAGSVFGSLDDCRHSMERLRTNPELRAELGRKGRLAYEAHWTEDVHMDRYLELVESLRASERRPEGGS